MIVLGLLIIVLGVALAGCLYGNTASGKYFRDQHEEYHKRQLKNLNK